MRIGIATLLLVLIWGGCTQKKESPSAKADPVVDTFEGRLTYLIRVEQADSNYLKRFFQYVPERVDIWMQDSMFRIQENGGASKGNIVINLKDDVSWQIDTIEKTIYQGLYANLDDAPESIKTTLPDHYRAVLEPTGNSEEINGFSCDEYRVTRSGFLSPDAGAMVWITKDLQLPSCRFDIETDVNRVSMPLPIQIGVDGGTVMRLSYAQGDQTIVYELTGIDDSEVTDEVFTLPTDYFFR